MTQPTKGEYRQRQRRHRHARLCDEHDATAIRRVRECPARNGEENNRHQTNEADHAERDRALVGWHEQRHVPQQGGRLHGGTRERNEQPQPEQPEVSVLKRHERGLR
jgi:hypothetical protein